MPDPQPNGFNLIERPWIPVQPLSGPHRLASLAELLANPGAFVGLATTIPTEFFALHRLLLAICHRAIGPGDADARADLLTSWPREQVLRYLDRWREHFDLFHPERPFMQVPELRTVPTLTSKPWTVLALDRASGNTKLLFDHSLDDQPDPLVPDAAARMLVAHLQFTPGGLVKALRTSGSQGPACVLQLVLPLGDTMQQTLALGLLPQAPSDHTKDLPPWETEPPAIETLRGDAKALAMGPAQRYTWLTRAVLLRPTSDAGPISALYAEGLSLADDPIPDPMAAQIRGKEGLLYPLRLDLDRAFWRDLHALTGEGGAVPPASVTHAVSMQTARDIYDPLNLAAGGLLPDQAKIDLWRLETRRITPALLQPTSNAISQLDWALASAQRVSQALQTALNAMCMRWLGQGGRTHTKSDATALMRQLNGAGHYWGALESPFWAFADRLGQQQPPDVCMHDWQQQVRAAAHAAWNTSSRLLGADSRGLAAQAQAAPIFQSALAQALNP